MIDIDILPASTETKGGDSVLIRIGDFNYNPNQPNKQKVILIDSGYKENAERIEQHLTEHYHTQKIDLAILTHPDLDHISGFYEIIQRGNIKIEKTMIHDPWNHASTLLRKSQDGRRTANSIQSKLDDVMSKLSLILDHAESFNSEPFGITSHPNFNITILGPSKINYQNFLHQFPEMDGEKKRKTINYEIYSDEVNYQEQMPHFLADPITSAKNDSSAVILLHDNQGYPIALFTGDVGVEGLSKALNHADEMGVKYQGVKLFQMPHHGSIKNITAEIINRVSPHRVYVSAPPKNPDHPSKLALNHITQKIKLPTYHVMDKTGTLFRFDGSPDRPGWTAKSSTVERFSLVRKLLNFIAK